VHQFIFNSVPLQIRSSFFEGVENGKPNQESTCFLSAATFDVATNTSFGNRRYFAHRQPFGSISLLPVFPFVFLEEVDWTGDM
jgi:hypothetical protein